MALAVGLLSWGALAAEVVTPLEGDVPDAGAFFTIPIEVPAGTVELEVRHDDESSANILDWGLLAPDGGFRGYGGGNTEAAVVGTHAASRSYLPGPLPAGTWQVLVGKAKVTEHPARWALEVVTRTEPTLAPQPERTPYGGTRPLRQGARWWAGDLHVHSRESGDAKPTLDAIATLAKKRGLDFVALSEHNTVSQLDFYASVQARHPDLLLVPSVEFTTYAGHLNGFGATRFVPFAFGLDGWTFEQAVASLQAQGAVLTINHPVLDLGDNCIGCAWRHPVWPAFGAIEIGLGGWDTTGALFDEAAIAFWESQADRGVHLAPGGRQR